MLNIILNTVGIVLIIYSIYIIKKDTNKENNVINELDLIEGRVQEYYNLTEEIIENFDEIIDSKLDMLNKDNKNLSKFQPSNENNLVNSLINPVNSNIDSVNSFHKKIIELNSIGLTKEEIAKKLNKGIREIDMVLKIYNVKK